MRSTNVMASSAPVAASDADKQALWPHRDLLLQRQQQLLLRSAELRGELASELRAGWRGVETPLDLVLRVRSVVVELRRRGRELRARHPWLAASAVLWPVLLHRVWRLVRRRKAAAKAAADKPGRLARLLLLVQWTRRAIKLWRLLERPGARSRPPA
ncbi:MAG: hypothetical protein IPG93_09550 [Burkholderiales bacterium]|nr:hypothetical protein [Burkholderiales bacterium]